MATPVIAFCSLRRPGPARQVVGTVEVGETFQHGGNDPPFKQERGGRKMPPPGYGAASAHLLDNPLITCWHPTVVRGTKREHQPNAEPVCFFMAIKRFRNRDSKPIYRRLRDEWRQMPAGLTDIDSWIEPKFERCFRLMKCDDARLL